MTPVEKLLAKLSGVKKSSPGWTALCPAHEDRTPSLSVSEGDDGRALVKCHAGCKVEEVVVAIDLSLADLMPTVTSRPSKFKSAKSKAPDLESPVASAKASSTNGRTFRTAKDAVGALERAQGKRSASWVYFNAGGEPVGMVIRWDLPDGSKTIRPVARTADGWQIGAIGKPRPLYNLPGLADAGRIVVVEGEKAADAARSLGFQATTSSGGAEAPHATDWQPLAGKDVWILPDNDDPGRKYAVAVTAILAALSPAPTVRILDLPGLTTKGDIVDWIADHGTDADATALRLRIEALGASVEPQASGTAGQSHFRPFPIEALPEPISTYVNVVATAIGCDPSYVALPLLIMLAAAIGSTRRLQLKRGWLVPAIVWGAIIGESGTAKTPAFKISLKTVRDRQRKLLLRHHDAMKQYETELERWDKERASWKRSGKASGDPPPKPHPPRCERFLVSDATVESLAPILAENPRGVLMARDELAGWIGSFDRFAPRGKAGTDSANWLSMHNGESIMVDRKTGTSPTIVAPQAYVSVIGGIQPGIFRRAFDKEHRESGLAARLLLTYPPRIAKTWTEADIDPEVEAALEAIVNRLYDLRPTSDDAGENQPISILLSPEAKIAFIGYYNDHNREQAEMAGDLAAAWSKLEEYAARLALVIHMARWAAKDPTLIGVETVDIKSMRAGIRLAEWFKNEAKRIYALLDESEGDTEQQKLLEWIRQKGGSVTAREVQQGCRWLKESGAAEAALEELRRIARGNWYDTQTRVEGGRPSRVFRLSL